MKNPLIVLAITGMLLSASAVELKNAKSIRNLSEKVENQARQKIKKDKKAQKLIQQLVNKAAKQIEDQAKKGFMIGARLQIHYSNSPKLLKSIQKYPYAEMHVIYDDFYNRLERKGYIVKDKEYGGAITETKVFWVK